MEGGFKRRMRNAMKRLQEEEELLRIPKVTTSVAERRRVELYTSHHCQFSKHLEGAQPPVLSEEEAERDLRFTKHDRQEEHLGIQRHLMEQKRLIETLQTKIKCLQEELKKVKDLDFKKSMINYRKTTSISNLLSEREKFHHEKKELVRISLQLQREKQQLSEQFEEELSRKTTIISDLLLDREKLHHENQELLRICGKKQRLCERFEEELSTRKRIICDLLSDRDKLQYENGELVGVGLQLRGEKQQLSDYFDEKLSRESKLRKDCCYRSLLCRDQLISLPSREKKRCFVSIWQTSAEDTKPEDKKESLEKMKPQFLDTLKKDWLKDSVNNLKTKKSKESRQNVLGWLQESLKNMKEVSNETPRPSLAEWLKGSLINLQKESPETFREDVNDWLDMSLNQLQEEGPETSHLDVQEWLEASIQGIQDLQKSEVEPRSSLRKEWLEKSIENLKKQSSEGPVDNILPWLQRSLESLSSSTEPKPVLEKWLQDSLKSLEEERSEVDSQDVKEWLQTTVDNLEEEGPGASHLSTQEWLEASIQGIRDLNEQYSNGRIASVEKSRERVIWVETASSEKSLRDGWLQASLSSSREHGSTSSRTGLQGWLQASLKRVRQESLHRAINNLEEWLRESIQNVEEGYPEESRQDVKEWLGIAQKHLQAEGPQTPHLSVEEWLETSVQALREESLKEMTGSRDPEMWRRKLLSKRIPSQSKQVVRTNLGKKKCWCRKKHGQMLKAFILLAMLLLALYVHFRLYCVVSERGLRPY